MKHLVQNIVILSACICLSCAATAQVDDAGKDYRRLYSELTADYAKDPDEIANLLAMSDFYADPDNPWFSLPLAMKYLGTAEKNFSAWVLDNEHHRQMSKLIRKGITIQSIRQKKQSLIEQATRYLDSAPNLGDGQADFFVKEFECDAAVVQQARSLKISQAFEQAKRQGTAEDYYKFLRVYAGTEEATKADAFIAQHLGIRFNQLDNEAAIDELANKYSQSAAAQRLANKRKSQLAFAQAEKMDTKDGYERHAARFVSGDEYMVALERLDSLLNLRFASLETPQEYVDFILANSDNPLADEALQILRDMIEKEHNVTAAELYLKNFPLDSQYDKVFRCYYNWFAEEGNQEPIERFANTYPNPPFHLLVQSDLEQSRRIDAFDLMRSFFPDYLEAYTQFIHMSTGKHIAFVALQRILQYDISHKDWKSAQAHLDKFELSFDVDCNKEYRQLKQTIAAKHPWAAVTEMSGHNDIRRPITSRDGKTLYYYSASHQICSSQQNGGHWGEGRPIRFANAANYNIEPFSLYDNDSKMLVGKQGDIYVAERRDSTWYLGAALPYPVNTDAVETDAVMLDDGTGILLASDRHGGQNIQASFSLFHGDTALATDLYMIPHTAQGWGEAVNLGNHINTPYCESSPIVSHDQQTLFFISDGHGGLGYGDIYAAVRTGSRWDQWSAPMNLGCEANSGFRENDLSLNTKNGRLYFASNATGYFACQSLATTPVVSQLKADSVTRRSLMETVPHALSALQSRNDTLLLTQTPVTISDSISNMELFNYIPLPKVQFETSRNGSEYLPACTELDLLATYMEQHPDLRINIVAHASNTDSHTAYRHSLRRGHAVRQYLSAHGIDASRLTILAYGNTFWKKTGKHEAIGIQMH